MQDPNQQLISKILALDPRKISEVEAFVDYLKSRERADQELTSAASAVAEASFADVWDNDEDADYDQL